MDKIILRAYGKINLGLDVVRKREDGYHEVNMIMQTVAIYDKLEIKKVEGNEIRLSTNRSYLPTNENNIVYKAVDMLFKEFGIKQGIDIYINKRIPVAAGMAGGSTDCAAALKGINELFELGLSNKELKKRGLKLGADVPYCLMGGTVQAQGIGEKLTKLKRAPKCFLLIAKPPISVSTKLVYENLDANNLERHPDIEGIIKAIEENDIYKMSIKLENVLETVTTKSYPIIEEIKDTMKQYGAINSIMSGSGPTVFGIFDDKEIAIKAYKGLKSKERYSRDVFLTTFKYNIDNYVEK